jgi:protein-S-isoprenylcysteine O-methyltransferase Ste14
MSAEYGYGLWALVVFNSLLFIGFAVSFFHPRSRRDWRALGGFSAFVVALFTEMYGYPLTIYLLSGPLSGLVGVDLSHNSGHLWNELIGWKGDPHASPFHLASYVFIIGGFWLIASGWKHLYAAQKSGRLATSGPYGRIRHPQYTGFALIMVGFLLQWPTFATLLMFPVLLYVYRRLAVREERDVAGEFGAAWTRYAEVTPRFVPRLRPERRRPVEPTQRPLLAAAKNTGKEQPSFTVSSRSGRRL